MDKNKEKVVFITGGGTGGHIYPALAIAKEIREQNFAKVFYLGKKNSLEKRIAQENGFNFLSYDVFGMPRKLSFDFLKWFIKLQMATFKALFYCYKYKPQAVLEQVDMQVRQRFWLHKLLAFLILFMIVMQILELFQDIVQNQQ